MTKLQPIYIVGQPGAGKAVLGKSIAHALRWPILDADFGLEWRVGLPSTAIIGDSGLDIFSQAQCMILQQHTNNEPRVIITDASLVSSDIGIDLLKKGFVVFVDVCINTQLQRLSVNDAPINRNVNHQQLLQQLHDQRDSTYRALADCIICSDDNAIDEHTRRVINALKEQLEPGNELRSNYQQPLKSIFLHKSLHKPIHLSKRQAECMQLLADGHSTKDIANALHISARTVEDHIDNIKHALGCESSKQLIALFHR